MKIDPAKQAADIDIVKPAARSRTSKPQAAAPARDAIRISDDIRALPGFSQKLAGNEDIRPGVIKRYADFVNRPLNVSDQNILSAIKRSMIT